MSVKPFVVVLEAVEHGWTPPVGGVSRWIRSGRPASSARSSALSAMASLGHNVERRARGPASAVHLVLAWRSEQASRLPGAAGLAAAVTCGGAGAGVAAARDAVIVNVLPLADVAVTVKVPAVDAVTETWLAPVP